jgi:hypothetical protein
MKVELIYDPDCPNAVSARRVARGVLLDRVPERWRNGTRRPRAPSYASCRLGDDSVDGKDVAVRVPAPVPQARFIAPKTAVQRTPLDALCAAPSPPRSRSERRAASVPPWLRPGDRRRAAAQAHLSALLAGLYGGAGRTSGWSSSTTRLTCFATAVFSPSPSERWRSRLAAAAA